MTIKEKVAKSKELQARYINLRANEQIEESIKVEKEYLELRHEIIESVDEEIDFKKSRTISELREEYKKKPKPIIYETGISVLDYELVTESQKLNHTKGGFSLGNLIQIAGAKGVGKSSLVVKLLSGFSLHQDVSWFNFEMGEDKVFPLLESFERNEEQMYYYDGKREIEEIIKEIKYLYKDNVKHFLIDSMMKINAQGSKRGYESFSTISSKLSMLTSQLGINIYLINQISQESERGGNLQMKHGNDAEYDSDYIFFLVKPFVIDERGKPKVDKDGMPELDENRRILHCTKNRDTHRLFRVDIKKEDIFSKNTMFRLTNGVEVEVTEYEMPTMEE